MLRCTKLYWYFFLLQFSIGSAMAEGRLELMFAAQWDVDAVTYVKNAFDENDYLSSELNNGRSKTFILPASISQVSRRGRIYCAKTKGMIIYDPEHWESTPKDELADLRKSVLDAVALTRKSSCKSFGIAPDGKTIGIQPKSCVANVSETINKLDWGKIDLVVIQAQRLLSDQCLKDRGTVTYSEFIKSWSIELKRRNPEIRVFSSMSFRLANAKTMEEAIKTTKNYIDGLYLAYPKSTLQNECKYCSVDQLKIVVESVKKQQKS